MTKLTQQQAQQVLLEAYKLKAQQAKSYGDSHARLGQSIHWVTTMGDVDEELKLALQQVLDSHHATVYDFFYWIDESDVLEVFYKHYVEQIN